MALFVGAVCWLFVGAVCWRCLLALFVGGASYRRRLLTTPWLSYRKIVIDFPSRKLLSLLFHANRIILLSVHPMSARDSVLSSLRAVEQSILTLTDKDDLKAIASRISYARSLCKVRSKLLASLILPKSRIPHQYYEFLFGSKHTNPVSRHERRIEDRLYRERKPKLLQLDPVASRFCGITYTLRELRNLDESDFNCLCGTIEDFVTKHKAWTSLAYDDLSQSGSLSYFQSSDYGEYCRGSYVRSLIVTSN